MNKYNIEKYARIRNYFQYCVKGIRVIPNNIKKMFDTILFARDYKFSLLERHPDAHLYLPGLYRGVEQSGSS